MQRCEAQLPKEKKITYVRADSASYQAKLFDYCEDNHVIYTIGAHLDRAVLKNIKEIDNWEILRMHDGKNPSSKRRSSRIYPYYA